jgi:hypothetical protein
VIWLEVAVRIVKLPELGGFVGPLTLVLAPAEKEENSPAGPRMMFGDANAIEFDATTVFGPGWC